MNSSQEITIQVSVQARIEKVWDYWTSPIHIKTWNTASEDWHTTKSENDLRVGGRFCARMEAKDGSMGFDFSGKYDSIKIHEHIAYTLDDQRKVSITFTPTENEVVISETFEAESENPIDMQRFGWQCILDHFKTYVESR